MSPRCAGSRAASPLPPPSWSMPRASGSYALTTIPSPTPPRPGVRSNGTPIAMVCLASCAGQRGQPPCSMPRHALASSEYSTALSIRAKRSSTSQSPRPMPSFRSRGWRTPPALPLRGGESCARARRPRPRRRARSRRIPVARRLSRAPDSGAEDGRDRHARCRRRLAWSVHARFGGRAGRCWPRPYGQCGGGDQVRPRRRAARHAAMK